MHIERIHKMIEKLTECALCEIEKGIECVNTEEMGEVIDMIKDLSEAEYKSLISKEMKEYKEEEKAEEKYMMKRFKEEYGDEEGEKRFYDDYRYKRSGRFAPKGKGSYMPRRGYEEPPYYHVMPDMYEDYNAEYMRDIDRKDGRMYFSGGGSSGGNSGGSRGGNSGGNSGGTSSGGMSGGSMGGSSRGYSEGYDDGNRRGYEDGYSDGQREGRRSGGSQSRYDRAKRGYEEAKEQHKGGTSEDKQITMREAEKFVNVATDEIMEMLEDASPEVKNMVKTKVMSKMQKM